MGLNDDAMRDAEQAARSSAAREAEREAPYWRRAEAHGRERIALWFRGMGVTNPPAVSLSNRRKSYGYSDSGTDPEYYNVTFSWWLKGHEYKATFDEGREDFYVKINLPEGSDDNRSGWRYTPTKISLGQALLEERRLASERSN